MKALRTIKGIEQYVSDAELKQEQIAILVSCGAMARREGSYKAAFKYLGEAILVSPRLVVHELSQRDVVRRLLRKVWRKLIHVDK